MDQGDIFWVDLGPPFGSEPGYRRPYVVVQNDPLNHGRIATVIACGITTNLDLAAAPGNVALEKGEAGLPRRSVVNVTQVVTMDKLRLSEYVGTLSESRIRQIVKGVALVIEPLRTGNPFKGSPVP